MERVVYSVDEAAEQLGINRKSVYDAIKRNEFPHVRVGNRLLVPKAQLERFLEASAHKEPL